MAMQRYDPLAAPDPQEWLAVDEGERIARIEEYHRRARVRLPNSTVHATTHAVIETQAALGDETPVRRTLDRLMSEGLDRHEAIHAIGMAFTDCVYDVISGRAREGVDPNPEYFAAVERVTAAGWRQAVAQSAEAEMDMTEILDALGERGGMPVEAIVAARAQCTDAVPAFLELIERYLEGEATSQEEDALLLIFHLLGEWREKSAYRPLARLLRQPGEELDEQLGDAISNTVHRVMAGVFDGDPQPLYDIIMDAGAGEFVRARMFDALAILLLRNELPRSELVRFLRACHSDMRPQSRCAVWEGWAHAIAVLGIAELKPLVARAFERGFIPGLMMTFEDFEEDLQRGIKQPGTLRHPGDDDLTLFGDTVEELSDWVDFEPKDVFDEEEDVVADAEEHVLADDLDDRDEQQYRAAPSSNPFKGVGRNDPCPCGSGKKFKKCCLNKAPAIAPRKEEIVR